MKRCFYFSKKSPSISRFGLVCCLFVWLALASLAFAEVEHKDPNGQGDLFEMSIEELLEIEVSVASKVPERQIEAPGIVVVVPKSEIEVYGDRNLYQLLQRQPSIYTRGSYLYPYNVASFRGDMATHLDSHTLLLINGRPVRDSAYGGYDFPLYMTYPLEGLEAVEIIRGPGSVLYGTNAFTGVVNLRPRAIPEETAFSVSSLGGSHGYYETTVSGGGRAGKLGYVTDVRTFGQQGFNYSMIDDTGTYGSMNDRMKSVSGTVHLERGGFTFDAFGSNLEIPYVGVIPRWVASNHDLRVNRFFGNLGYRADLHERMTLDLNLTYNLLTTDFARIGTGDVDKNSEDWIGEVTLHTRPTDKLNIVLGFLQENQRKIGGDESDPVVDPPYDVEPQSAYAQGDYKIGDSIKLIAGTQWNKAAYGITDLSSRFGVILKLHENWGLKLLRGEAFRAPFALETSLVDMAVLIGNKELEPEKITTYDVQLFYHDEKTYAAATYFNSEISNLIIRANNPAPPPPRTYTNGGQQEFQGIELELKRFLTEHWHILGSFMHQENNQTSDVAYSVVPDDMFKFGTGYTWDWGSAGLFYSFFGKPPRLASEVVVNPEPDAINLLSLNVQIDPSKWFNIPKGRSLLTFKVENLFDEDIYVPEFQRAGNPNSLPYGPGRTFYCGLKMYF